MIPATLPCLRPQLRRAVSLGHGAETRAALARLDLLLKRGSVTVLGPLAPDAALCELYRRRGALEGSPDDSRAPTRAVVVPPMSSATICTSGSSTTSRQSAVIRSAGSGRVRAFFNCRTASRVT